MWARSNRIGTNRKRPSLDQALAAVRAAGVLIVPKLDRLARSVSDALGLLAFQLALCLDDRNWPSCSAFRADGIPGVDKAASVAA
jgi:hypothetical protein